MAKRGVYKLAPKIALAKSVAECPDCKNHYIVYRTVKNKRSYRSGHIKDLWCFKCKRVTKHIQLDNREAKYNY